MVMYIAALVQADGLVARRALREWAVRNDLKHLQGTWKAVRFEVDGQPVDAADLESIRLVIRGADATFTRAGVRHEGRLALDPIAMPRAIDIVRTSGPDLGTTLRGIYKIDGDRLRVCLGRDGRARPADFDSRPGTVLKEWRRVSP